MIEFNGYLTGASEKFFFKKYVTYMQNAFIFGLVMVLPLIFMLMRTFQTFATVYKGNIIKNLIMDCQSYTKYRPNETTGGIFVSWRRKEELPTGA